MAVSTIKVSSYESFHVCTFETKGSTSIISMITNRFVTVVWLLFDHRQYQSYPQLFSKLRTLIQRLTKTLVFNASFTSSTVLTDSRILDVYLLPTDRKQTIHTTMDFVNESEVESSLDFSNESGVDSGPVLETLDIINQPPND